MSRPAALAMSSRWRPLAWRWPAAWHWRRPGVPLLAIGLLALCLAAGLLLVLVPRWQADAAAAGQALHQRAARMPARPPQAAQPGPARQLHEALPPAALAPQRLAELLALARRHGLTVVSVHQAAPVRGEGVDSVPLAWHAQGPYAGMRGFVAAALQADPGLVLDQLRLSRSDPRAALLEADLQWQLLQRAEATAPPPPAAATAAKARP